MFDPWAFIGWFVVGCIAAVGALVLLVLALFLAARLRLAVRRRRSRNIPPRKGQRWQQDDGVLNIVGISDDGRVQVRTDGYSCYASWVDTPEEWRARVRNRGLILIEGPGHG